MKNAILMSVAAFALAACASHEPAPQVAAPAPAPRPAHSCGVRAAQPAAAPAHACNACSKSYTVSEPVEVVYKNVTYTTVYEPKTYSNTTYVKKPYSCKEGELCAQKQVVPASAPAAAPAPVVINQ